MARASHLLLPLSALYRLVTDVRNWGYDRGHLKSTSFETPTLSVGNLAVGGTGKTPMVEYLIELLGKNLRLATLSRGYGRKTEGFRIVQKSDNAASVGDEPYQYFHKYGDRVTVSVGEDRVAAIRALLAESHPELIVLDDALQHRALQPGIQLLLTEHQRPFYNDMLMPAGRLREARKHARRADAVVVTKCPSQLDSEEMQRMHQHVAQYVRTGTPVFFSRIAYKAPVPLYGHGLLFSPSIYLFTGIARPRPLENYVRAHYDLSGVAHFPDHHFFTERELRVKILAGYRASGAGCILTTEKDAMRLTALPSAKKILAGIPIFYLPIAQQFIPFGHQSFDQWIRRQLEAYQIFL
jgi:tetraacyldisaccharide 4'-kinase